MDSRLLNVVYDDPFDGNYVKYDNDTEFWSSGSETMGMQLTETLNGILPIAPTEDFHNDDHHTNAINLQNTKNSFNYEDFAGQHLTNGGAFEIVTVNPNADGYDTDSEDEEDSDDEMGHIDDNDLFEIERQNHWSDDDGGTFRTRTDSSSIGDYESHTSDYDDDDDEDDDEEEVDDEEEEVNVKQNLFNNTSLIQNTLVNNNNSIIDLHTNLMQPDDLLLDAAYHKNRTLSTNTLNSDVDGLGLQIDANNFDLAEFITKDDFQLQNNLTPQIATTTTTTTTTNNFNTSEVNKIKIASSVVQVISSKCSDSDSDSDVIVDVETVEMDEDDASSLRKASEILKPNTLNVNVENNKTSLEEDVPFVDNIKSDPSWSPAQSGKKVENYKVEENSVNQKSNFTRNFPLVPNKKQCDLLKGKYAKGKLGKFTPKTTKPSTAKNNKLENSPCKESSSAINSLIKSENPTKKIGLGMGGKNLALLKHERVSISEQSSEENNTPLKQENKIQKQQDQQQKPVQMQSEQELKETPAQKAQAVKRKLNLEEYKKRREGEPTNATTAAAAIVKPASTINTTFLSYKIPKFENKSNNSTNNNKNQKLSVNNNTTPTKHSEAVTSIVKSLKEQQQQQNLLTKPVTDPITEAKNKVLRMQELKKAQQMRIIDSTISAKVPRVTKLLPLREIVKDTPYLNEQEKKSLNCQSLKSDYEEIIIVSASCNTDISIPPLPNQAIQPVNNVSRSLLKSSALLSTITNTFQKVKAIENAKLTTSSLITSIQDVVVKKTLPVPEETNDAAEGEKMKESKKPEHHGEDKIIMHLRKDRIRKRMCSVSIQTDLQPEFPPLPLPKSSLQHKSRERTRRNRKRQFRKHNEQSLSSTSTSSSEYSSNDHSDHSNSSSISRSRDNSCSSSLDRMRTYDSAIGTGGYSSRSSRKHRSSISSSYSESADRVARGRRQRRTSYTKRSAARKRSRSPYSSSSSYTSDSDRSRSPLYRRSRSRSTSRPRSRTRRSSYRRNHNNNYVDRNVSQPAVEERRIVYVGRIEQETTKDMLRRKFLQYGTIKQISIHYKDTGMKYGFVTFERSQDAFAAIDNSTRDPQINMYDVSFGGRRAFCRQSYADLDNAGINTYQSYVFPQLATQPKEEDSFEALLMKMKAKLNANKSQNTTTTNGGGGSLTETSNAAPNDQNKTSNKI
ncbi:PGC-1 family member spargel [Cochliomyia hominivorax]